MGSKQALDGETQPAGRWRGEWISAERVGLSGQRKRRGKDFVVGEAATLGEEEGPP